MAAGLVIGMAGCAENGADVDGKDGENAALRLSIKIPAGMGGTRADYAQPGDNDGDPINATEEENKITSVTVYVFGANGVKATVGGVNTFAIADFDDTNEPEYVLETPYDVTSGKDSRIYVGLNVPSAWQEGATEGEGGFATESALLAAVGSIGKGVTPANQLDEIVNNGLTFFSEVDIRDLVAYDAATDNVVTAEADLTRVASKVVATHKAANIATDPAATWSNGVVMTYNVLEYNVYNEAAASYLAKKTNGTTLSAPIRGFDESYYKDMPAGTKGGGNAVVRNDAAYNGGETPGLAGYDSDFFIAENHSKMNTANGNTGGISLVGNTTYAMIATQVHVGKTAVINAAGDGIEWTGAANNIAENGTEVTSADDLWIVVKPAEGANAAQTFIVKGEPDGGTAAEPTYSVAEDMGTLLGGTAAGVKIYHYPDSFVHFMVWLNREAANDYRIGRNEYIHIDIQGVKALDGNFPGYPGDPTDPKKPIDPTGDDPDNPDPIEIIDPVEPLDAKLIVKITVKPWTYRHNVTILQ